MTQKHLKAARFRRPQFQWWQVAAAGVILLGGGYASWSAVVWWVDPWSPATAPGCVHPLAPETSSEVGNQQGSKGGKASGPAAFRNVTDESGLNFTYRNGEEADQYTILETLGGGVALFDYDGDGRLDIFVTGGGYFDGPEKHQIKGLPCKLYQNLGNWKFKDVSVDAALAATDWWYTHGAAVADYDRDGWPDLLVTGYRQLALFHNEPTAKGGRRLVDVTEIVGLRDDLWSTSAGWGDVDGDGFPDLYVCHYVDWSFANNPPCKGTALGIPRDTCGPEAFRPLVHALFQNEQGRSFRNVAREQGFQPKGSGLGVVLADLNDDACPDIYVANDTNRNFLFYNRDGRLEDKGLEAGVASDETGKPDGSMGVDAADYDGTGRPSLWVTNFAQQVHGLYLNLGQENFHHQSRAAGIAALGQSWVSFGTGFFDLENDGWEDLVIVSGHVWRHPVSGTPNQSPILLHNNERNGRRFYSNVSSNGGAYFQSPAVGRGLAIGDLDNDGFADLVVSHTNSPVALLRNEGASRTRPPRWLGIKLAGRDYRDVVGSTVVINGAARKLTRFTKGGGSYLSANDPRLLFGLGEDEAAQRVTVKWSWGGQQTWENLEPQRYWELTEGEPNGKSLSGSAD